MDISISQSRTLSCKSPFPFFIAHDVLPQDNRQAIGEHFPAIKGAGFLPYLPKKGGNAFNELIEQLESPEFSETIGQLLGIENLHQFPTYISISARLNRRHGTIHTDGKSKIATVLLYLNDNWDFGHDGCLRFLHSKDDINDMVVGEIPPIFGTLAGFKRTDNSFHGHLPFQGERRVIQIAWLTSQENKDRKGNRGKLSRKIKAIFGSIDTRWGAGRKDSAHKD